MELVGDWLNLAIRWAHIITGIAWIGSSFYFMWLDSHLEKPDAPREGIEGELWMVHSGGFYQVEKIDVAPKVMPRTLHWFVWEATFTWITGALLLVVVYYLGARVFMIDPAVADLTPVTAIAIGAGTIAVTWFAYDALWASPMAEKEPGLCNVISLVALVAIAYMFTRYLSGRAAFIHTGALMGTIMAANVWRRIIPGQRALVAASRAGTTPDPAYGIKAKQRSVHNNYMTLPVVFTMISSHYPMTYGHPWNWVILLALFVIGAAIRHYFNMRNAGRERAGLPFAAAGVIAFLALAFVVSVLPRLQDQASGPKVAFAAVDKIVGKHCIMCHAAKPKHEGFDKPPKNVTLETPAQIRRWVEAIKKQAVDTTTMPLGNETKMTAGERATLGRWIAQGASVE
jgi:uncharacterized membrane protein